MRILLLQSYLGRPEPPIAPLGLATLAAQLPATALRLFDPNVARQPLPDSLALVEDFHPDLIGVSLRNVDTTKYSDPFLYFQPFRDFIGSLRRIAKGIPIAVGGGGFSLYAHEIMARLPEIDLGFYLEADESFPRFVARGGELEEIPGLFFRRDGHVVYSGDPPRINLDQLKPPAWELVDLPAYLAFTDRASLGVEGKRGCAMTCAYCTYPYLSGSQVRMKSPVKVVDEVERLHRDFGVQRVFFCDPVFNYPVEHAEAISREMLKRRIGVRWGAYHQDRFLTAEYVALARAAGCDDFYFSPDAATEKGFRVLQKASTKQSLNASLDIIRRDGQARASYNFFAAIPETGWANFWAAVGFILKAKWKLGRRLTRTKLSYIRLEPNTALSRQRMGLSVLEEERALLPERLAGLDQTFLRTTRSAMFNALLFVHYHWGKWFGRKNVLRVK